MKKTITLFCLLLMYLNSFAQDQVKTQYSKNIFEGKIFEIDTDYLKIRQLDLTEKKINFESIDSIYTSSDSLKKKLRFKKGTRDKLAKTKLIGLTQDLRNKSNIDTISYDPKEIAKSLEVAQVNILRINQINKNAGRAIGNAGSLLIAGSISAIMGSYLLTNGAPKSGLTISLIGGVMSLIGCGKLISSGNILQRTSGNDFRVGLGNEGLAIQLRF
jgi:hypothetical protein